MKVFGFFTVLLATVATTVSAISSQERDDWQGCTNNLISAYKEHRAGDPTSCKFWRCLQTNARKYRRGGGITLLSNVITPMCIPIELLWDPKNSPEPSWQETEDWRSCTRDLIATFDKPEDDKTSGNKAACRMWSCLHNNVSKYHRGGLVTRTSRLLTPFCDFAGLIPDWN